ncbi:MAG: SpoIIE family protein phosphatase [Halieaceae bacterium]|jgi:serine phosphatase RsbU (regulator of sigma subunit)|nr:SpoIIE family protein phosphatase [Halieaceae bacterium]
MAEQSGKILLLEKDAQTANAIADRLVAQGYYVEISEQVDPSLDGDIDDDVDVVLCDLDLPDISWEGVFEVLSERQQEVSAIMLSSHEQVVDIMTALRLGFRDFFHKPIDDWDALLSSVARCAEESRLRRENAAYRAKLEGTNAELRGTVQVLEQDQQAGRHVQMRMLPQSPVEIDGFRFSHSVIPSLYLSGDYTDYFRVGEGHAVFVISDVSGHGSSSAFVTVLLKNLLARKRSDFIHRDDYLIMNPVEMLQRANRDLLELGIGKFATVVMGVIDLDRSLLRYSIAGHLPLPVLVTPEGASFLHGAGTAVGIMEDAEFEEHSIELPPEFMLALFTDGILEILPPDNLVDKERFFLEAFSGGFQTPMQVSHRLGLDQIETIPDDIAALYLERKA